MANRYFGKCCICGAEIVSFHSGLSPCNLMGCGGRGFCRFPASNLTPLAPDAGDSAASSGIVNASAEPTSQAEPTPTQRG